MERPDTTWKNSIRQHALRLALIIAASVIMALNINSFVDAGGLFPGGFNGLTLLIQRSAEQFGGIALPFSLINFLLNALPAVISFRLIGKRFTLYSCLMIVLTSVLTDVLPAIPITNDVLLICIFGGLSTALPSVFVCSAARQVAAPILLRWRCRNGWAWMRGIMSCSATLCCW